MQVRQLISLTVVWLVEDFGVATENPILPKHSEGAKNSLNWRDLIPDTLSAPDVLFVGYKV